MNERGEAMGMLYRRKVRDPLNGTERPTGCWLMKWYEDGKPFYQSTRKYKRSDAQKVLDQKMGKVAAGIHETPRLDRVRFDDLIDDLKTEYAMKGRKTWDRREQHLAHLKPVFGMMRVRSITTEKLKAYTAKRLEEKASPATINRELDCLHRMFVLGQRQTPPMVAHIPHFPKLAENNVREGFFDHDEFLALRGAAPDFLKVALTIAYHTGMRLREIIGPNGLRWEQHVDLRSNCLRLSANQTKTRKPRVVYMDGDFLRVMLKAKEIRDRDFPNCPYVCHRDGKPFNWLRHVWLQACDRIGLKGKTFHDLRRTGVRNLIRAGVPETVAMRISGHSTRSVFDRYNITSEDDLKQAATRLHTYLSTQKSTVMVADSVAVGDRRESQPEDVTRNLLICGGGGEI